MVRVDYVESMFKKGVVWEIIESTIIIVDTVQVLQIESNTDNF